MSTLGSHHTLLCRVTLRPHQPPLCRVTLGPTTLPCAESHGGPTGLLCDDHTGTTPPSSVPSHGLFLGLRLSGSGAHSPTGNME